MSRRSAGGTVEAWIFDLDNTLYSGDEVLFGQIVSRITDYISRYLALHPRKALALQKQYLAEYGTSLSGMMAVHGMDPADFLDYVHDIDLAGLAPDPALVHALAALPGRKYIFTNGSRGHALNIGTHLGIYDLFDGVFAIEDMNYTPKPSLAAYQLFLDAFKIDPARAVMFEDTARNLEPAKKLGMVTVLVAGSRDPHPAAVQYDSHTRPAFIDHFATSLAGWLTQYGPSLAHHALELPEISR